MSFRHAIGWTDHPTAKVLEFDAEQVQARGLHVHASPRAQHGSGVLAEREFYADVCTAIDGSHSPSSTARYRLRLYADQLLVLGATAVPSDLRRSRLCHWAFTRCPLQSQQEGVDYCRDGAGLAGIRQKEAFKRASVVHRTDSTHSII